jgi:hypothetical protein
MYGVIMHVVCCQTQRLSEKSHMEGALQRDRVQGLTSITGIPAMTLSGSSTAAEFICVSDTQLFLYHIVFFARSTG